MQANQKALQLENAFYLGQAGLLAQKDFIVPIPGTKKISRIEENIGSLAVTFTEEE